MENVPCLNLNQHSKVEHFFMISYNIINNIKKNKIIITLFSLKKDVICDEI